MSPICTRFCATFGALFVLALPAARAAPPDADTVVDSAWQHHRVKFDYTGHTTLYTCSGLELQVAQVLHYLGARADTKVHASGCQGLDRPSRFAWVDADFYTLTPAVAAGASTADAGALTPDAGAGPQIKAHWSAAELTPQHPSFNSDGNCELFESMKDVILKNFTLREFDYRTSCVPHSLSPNGFHIKGDVLKQTLAKAG